MAYARILVVDDEALIRWSLKERLTSEGYDVAEATSASEALTPASSDVDLILLDFQLPDGNGLEVLRRVKERSPEALVIMMTAYSTVENAVAAMKLGAFHYVNKPFNLDEVVLLVAQALETGRLRREVRSLRSSQGRDFGFDAIIGASPAMQTAKALMARVAASPASTVLLTGETEPGKTSPQRQFTSTAIAQHSSLSISPARRYPSNCSKANCSAMSAAHSLMHDSRSAACSRSRMAGRCSSMRSAR